MDLRPNSASVTATMIHLLYHNRQKKRAGSGRSSLGLTYDLHVGNLGVFLEARVIGQHLTLVTAGGGVGDVPQHHDLLS